VPLATSCPSNLVPSSFSIEDRSFSMHNLDITIGYVSVDFDSLAIMLSPYLNKGLNNLLANRVNQLGKETTDFKTLRNHLQ